MKNLYTDYKCIKCLFDKYSKIENTELSENDKTLYIKDLLKIILNAPTTMSAPEIVENITQLQKKYGLKIFDYTEIKKQYNKHILSYFDEIWDKITESKDSLYTAMSYAFTGNYIDFGAVSDISENNLKEMIDNTINIRFNQTEYENFKRELETAKNIAYLTDNCGEIVFDKLLIKYLKENYPSIDIKVIVRGKDVLNDATMVDAEEIGLLDMVPVISNGTGIAGTVLERIDKNCLEIINKADLIISKGMGNFETLKGAGLNIYYMFLCKCLKFCDAFDVPKFTYMFLNEKRMWKDAADYLNQRH